jgi:hypothetical protein
MLAVRREDFNAKAPRRKDAKKMLTMPFWSNKRRMFLIEQISLWRPLHRYCLVLRWHLTDVGMEG